MFNLVQKCRRESGRSQFRSSSIENNEKYPTFIFREKYTLTLSVYFCLFITVVVRPRKGINVIKDRFGLKVAAENVTLADLFDIYRPQHLHSMDLDQQHGLTWYSENNITFLKISGSSKCLFLQLGISCAMLVHR